MLPSVAESTTSEEPIEIDRGDGHEAEEQGGPDHRQIL